MLTTALYFLIAVAANFHLYHRMCIEIRRSEKLSDVSCKIKD